MKALIGLLMISLPALAAERPMQAAAFEAFAPQVKLRWDAKFLYVESTGLPAHDMMVGITSWQQQVPLPQAYRGDNAWRIPLHPVPAKEPRVIEGNFLRGAIALAANGVPIFNPQNNRGEVAAEIGELDQWGGHCGRADDYHYHTAPLHLERTLGKGRPIAFALDGYPVYGLTEPDGSPVGTLDKCHGHETAALGYHYHAATRRPYLQSAFHGEVVEAEGQVDPQPRAQGVREALPPLRGAEITAFASTGADSYQLDYTVNGDKRSISYRIQPDGTYPFVFNHGSEGTKQEIYSRRAGGGRPREKGPRENPPPASKAPVGSMMLRSPVVADGGLLPEEFTGDGGGATLPLEWSGAPAGTQSFALVMHHLDPEGVAKWYWTLYDIPANVARLPKNVQGVGKLGTGFRGKVGYEPPHSKGPGPKTYTLTLYALSAAPQLSVPSSQVSRQVLLGAIKGSVLASTELNVVYSSKSSGETPRAENRPPPPQKDDGLVKPAISDTIRLNVYADNWFMLYINGKLAAVDPIDFTPHNVVSVDILPEYPMTIAVLAKDNADPKSGLEYGSQIGDGGLVLKFGDGTVTNATWKAKSFFHGPVNGDAANPQVKQEPLPPDWWAVNFDDRSWPSAKEYTVGQVDPKAPYFASDFQGAKFIWSADLALDNTVIFRTTVEKPGWHPRWTTKPDLDVTGAPAR
ncbi:YHYH protein [bacterium]|nr:YHYH protein [bacterium]